MTPAEFLEARLADLQAGAWAIHDVSKCDALLYEDLPASAPLPDALDCECGYPARVLRQVAAMRAILQDFVIAAAFFPSGKFEQGYRDGRIDVTSRTLAYVAAIWSDHPDYDEGWGVVT